MRVPGNAQLPAQIEELVLAFGKACAHVGGERGTASTTADEAVELIDGAVGLDPRIVLGHAEPSPRPVVPSSPVRV